MNQNWTPAWLVSASTEDRLRPARSTPVVSLSVRLRISANSQRSLYNYDADPVHLRRHSSTYAVVHFAGSRSTGKERDTESGNDYFGARYYASSMGRFMSPDWSDESDPVPFAEFENPQSLNLYAYVNNNPLRSVDPDGHMHQECQHVAASSSSDAQGNITMTTAHDECKSVPDFWDYPNIWASKAGSATRQFADNHPNLGKALAPDCPDPANCVQVGMVPWGMTGGLGAEANTINHIFGPKSIAKHKLESLVVEFGSKEGAYTALKSATEAAVSGTVGQFEKAVQVGTQAVTVRGSVIDGVVKISTAFVP
jgi:RHS repeat-associated protein